MLGIRMVIIGKQCDLSLRKEHRRGIESPWLKPPTNLGPEAAHKALFTNGTKNLSIMLLKKLGHPKMLTKLV